MSEINRLPDDLTPPHDLQALEAALSSYGPAPSRLVAERRLRDELMFQAGRASVAASQANVASRSVARSAPRTWVYSLTSAAAAALVAVLVTRSLSTSEAPTVVINESQSSNDATVNATLAQAPIPTLQVAPEQNPSQKSQQNSRHPIQAVPRFQREPARAYAVDPWRGIRVQNVSWLALQDEALREGALRGGALRQETSVADYDSSLVEAVAEAAYQSPKTAQELRAELLPSNTEATATPKPWQWLAQPWLTKWPQPGESI